MNKLAGTLFVYNGNKFDYCFREAIQCLLEFCDFVIVAAGGDDGTLDDVRGIERRKPHKMALIEILKEEWDDVIGKEKLNYFTNWTIECAHRFRYEYQFNLQADEIVHEKSYAAIHEAVNNQYEGYLSRRINLWSSPYHQLNVSKNRMPCNDEIVRLAKCNYRSYGDAESIAVDDVNTEYLDRIRIYHLGFVRKKDVMKQKVINMQENVFGIDHDPKLDGSDLFIPERWFSGNDLKVIDEPLPLIIRQWAKDRI